MPKTEAMNLINRIISLYSSHSVPKKVREHFFFWLLSKKYTSDVSKALENEWGKVMKSGAEMSDDFRISMLMDIHRRIGVPNFAKEAASHYDKRGLSRWLSIAAAIIVVFVMMTVEYVVLRTDKSESVTCLVASSNSKGDFELPDGSHIWLNSGGKLAYSGDFTTSRFRKVKLEGEAFFDVAKDGRPFIVEAGDLDIKVLGTKFNVRHSYFSDNDEVTLQSGKVQVSCASFSDVILSPGENCVYNTKANTMSVRKVNSENYSNWTKNYIYFDNETLSNIILNLEHWYNINVTVDAGVNLSDRLSFKLIPEPLQETLKVMELLVPIECKVTDEHNVLITNQKH